MIIGSVTVALVVDADGTRVQTSGEGDLAYLTVKGMLAMAAEPEAINALLGEMD